MSNKNKVMCAPQLTEAMRERMATHRTNLMMAVRALPSDEVLDLMAAALVARTDVNKKDVDRFMKAANEWAWGFL